ncbi:MAG: GNAT family N-acetyltransferase [Planctomycetota bacterium]
MVFASTELAARIEGAECRLVAESTRAAAGPGREPFVRSLAGGVATLAGAGSPLNKVAGLGFAGPLEPHELDDVEREFARRGQPVQVELSTLADPAVGALLTERDYVLRGFEDVLGRAVAADGPPPPGEVEVRRSPAEELDAWLQVVVDGFAAPDDQGLASHEDFPREILEGVLRDMARAGGIDRYVALLDGAVAGAASMRLDGPIAQLCGAATLPAYRRRGVQTTLLAARLAAAAAAGCELAVMTALPGSKSHENAERRGFGLLYARAILIREG